MPPSPQNLDEKFGVCIPPGKVRDIESKFKPVSYINFNNGGSNILKGLFDKTQSGCYISYCLYSEFTILWLINQEGELIVSIEEVVADEDGAERYPLPRRVPYDNPIRHRRLGHPSLVGGGVARIAGELSYEPETETWYLTNRSGRFGANVGRSPDQLEEVAKRFRDEGFTISTLFVGLRT